MDVWSTVPARLTMNDRRALKALAEIVSDEFESPVIVNIGIWRGGSMYCLRAGAPSAVLIGIDIRAANPHLEEELAARIIQGNSCTCGELVDAPVHLVFIDGNHHLEAVRCDIAQWVPKVPFGGVVAIHDYNPPGVSLAKPALVHLADVKVAVDEWQAEDPYWEQIYAEDSMVAFRRVSDSYSVHGDHREL